MLTFRDSIKTFELDGYLLETMTNCDFMFSNSNPQDRKLIYAFVKEMNLIMRQQGQKIAEINLR